MLLCFMTLSLPASWVALSLVIVCKVHLWIFMKEVRSGLGVVQEDGIAAAVSAGGQHISCFPSAFYLCIQEHCLADPLLSSIIDLTFSATCCSIYLCPELTQR